MDNLLSWFTLKSVPGVGNYTFKRLLEAFDSPDQVLAASKSQLIETEGISTTIAAAIKNQAIPEAAHRNIELCQSLDISIITFNDPNYPALLQDLPDPPPYVYIQGEITTDAACLAIVGSRNPTSYGLSLADQLSRELADSGLVIVSGLARGIDTAAHQGALAVGGTTWAVLGSGLAQIYPPENKKLSLEIQKQGAVISEFPVFATPEPHHFPARNRIISGLCVGTIVVEAAKKSGSLITARLAAEQGRDVFAVPGSAKSPKSTGTHGLLKQGAKLVENGADVLEEIAHMLPSGLTDRTKTGSPGPTDLAQPNQELDKDEFQVLKLLEPYPIHIDEIDAKLSLAPGKIAGILLKLELKGLVKQEPGKYFHIN